MIRLPRLDPRTLGLLITVLALAAIGVLTLRPDPDSVQLASTLPITCLVCGWLGGVDVLLNTLLFMPLGFGLRLSGMPTRRAVLIGGVLSLTIETVQFAFLAGRDASLSDLLTNTVGTLLGALLAGAIASVLLPSERRRRRLVGIAAAAWLALLLLAAAAFQLTLPRTVWWGQWQADLPHLYPFEGTVLSILLDGVALPNGRMRESDAARARMADGRTDLVVRAVPAEPPVGTAPLASVYDEDRMEIVLLGQRGRSLVYRVHARAIDFRLRPPAIRLDGVFPVEGGDTMVVEGDFDQQRLTVRATTRGGSRAFSFTPNISSGWALFIPIYYSFGPEATALGALWLGVLALPLGYWGWRRGGGLRPLAVPVAAITVGLAGIPPLFGYPAETWTAWAGAAAGLVIGWGLAFVVRGRIWTAAAECHPERSEGAEPDRRSAPSLRSG